MTRLLLCKLLWNVLFLLAASAPSGSFAHAEGSLREGSRIESPSSTPLPLRGKATFRYYGFAVYDATLSMDRSVDVESDVPKVLQLHYRVAIKKQDLCSSTKEILRTNPAHSEKAIQATAEIVCPMFVDVTAGDAYTLEYIPGAGSKLLLNGIEQGRIPIISEGAEVSKMFLGIWLSDHSVGRSFTRKLRGR